MDGKIDLSRNGLGKEDWRKFLFSDNWRKSLFSGKRRL
jgi:hypothetical protein